MERWRVVGVEREEYGGVVMLWLCVCEMGEGVREEDRMTTDESKGEGRVGVRTTRVQRVKGAVCLWTCMCKRCEKGSGSVCETKSEVCGNRASGQKTKGESMKFLQ
mmetsp:Transcript_21158/g.55010  ORF Transcript_21158/g.55010 Transcript_21158/m.55010 type:complete len:106 (+) Transcript_21158:2495-2812(+)